MAWALQAETSVPVQTAFAAASVQGRWIFRGQGAAFSWTADGGDLRWVRRMHGEVQFPETEIVGAGGLAVTFEDRGAREASRLCAFDPETGEEAWSSTLGVRGHKHGIIARGDQVAVRGSMKKVGRALVLFDAASGRELRRVPFGVQGGGLACCGDRLFAYGQEGIQWSDPGGLDLGELQWTITLKAVALAGGLAVLHQEPAEGWACKLSLLRNDAIDAPVTLDAPSLDSKAMLSGDGVGRRVAARMPAGGGVALFDFDSGGLVWHVERSDRVSVAWCLWTPYGWLVQLTQSGEPAQWVTLHHDTGERVQEFEASRAPMDCAYWLDGHLVMSSPTRLHALCWAP